MLRLRSRLRRPLTVAVLPLGLCALPVSADMWEDRAALHEALAGYREAGLMMPVETDFDRYRDADLVQALAIARGAPGDACARAVQLSLYMDAHRAGGARRDYDSGPLADPAALWAHPEGGDVFAPLAWGWSPDLLGTVEGLEAALPSREVFVASAQRTAAESRDLWLQEIVALGLESGWDGAELIHAEARLDYAALRALEWIRSTETWARTRIEAADEGFRRGLEQAERDWQEAQAALRREVGTWRYADPQDGEVVFRKGDIDNAYRADRATTYADRARAITEAMVVREENLRMALEDLARARVQKAGVQLYLGPILSGDCASLARRY